MRTSNKWLLASFLIGVAVIASFADPKSPRTYAQYDQPAGYPTLQPIVPANLAQYNGDAPTVYDMMRELKEIKARLEPEGVLSKKMDYIITLADGTAQGQAVTTMQSEDAFTSGARKCVSCHKEGSTRKNGGFLLWNKEGQPYTQSHKNCQSIVGHLKGEMSPKMPPDGSPQLTPAEFRAWVAHFSQ